MFEKSSLALKYIIFALIATAANIGAQDVTVRLYHGPFFLALAMVVGTGVGLVIKYWLDKTYIFRYQTRSTAHEGSTFVLYSVMGLLTTAIFWGFEFGFEYLFGTKSMRYFGAIIGLAIGYILKYYLDKKYVFSK